MAVTSVERESSGPVLPPGSLAETGLELPFIADLVLKLVYYSNQITAQAITDEICLPFFNVVDRALAMLKREELIEVVGSQGFGQLAYQYSITSKGNLRVHEVLDRTTYVGPAPITLEHYQAVAASQINANTRVSPDDMRRVLADLVLDGSIIDSLGQAVNTGRSLFLYGPPGNGKTVLAEHIVPLLGDDILIPYAITVDGQVIKVLDLHNHEPIEIGGGRVEHDRRFMLCRRPAIVVGGELTLATLDLVYDHISKIYEAPLQLKANGGMMMIDDFGRQQVEPRQLLNRWIVPLEKRVDYLTLHTGKKIQVPFNQMVVFSTNLAPADLVDEAFLRRIQNKILVDNPSLETFREIFRRQCDALGVPFDQQGLLYLLREYYVKQQRELRAVQPRDLLRTLVGIARYRGIAPTLSPELIEAACQTYFVTL